MRKGKRRRPRPNAVKQTPAAPNQSTRNIVLPQAGCTEVIMGKIVHAVPVEHGQPFYLVGASHRPSSKAAVEKVWAEMKLRLRRPAPVTVAKPTIEVALPPGSKVFIDDRSATFVGRRGANYVFATKTPVLNGSGKRANLIERPNLFGVVKKQARKGNQPGSHPAGPAQN